MAPYGVVGFLRKKDSMSIYEIWYMKPEWFSNGMRGDLPEKSDLSKTHILLKSIAVEGWTLEKVWIEMQADVWSPNGEARDTIKMKGLGHTSMCVGDVIVKDGDTYVAQTIGFRRL